MYLLDLCIAFDARALYLVAVHCIWWRMIDLFQIAPKHSTSSEHNTVLKGNNRAQRLGSQNTTKHKIQNQKHNTAQNTTQHKLPQHPNTKTKTQHSTKYTTQTQNQQHNTAQNTKHKHKTKNTTQHETQHSTNCHNIQRVERYEISFGCLQQIHYDERFCEEIMVGLGWQ